MKRSNRIIICSSLVLLWTGCQQTQPDILERVIFTDGDEWVERDVGEDPYELVSGQCCNDYRPKPLPMDTTITPEIVPANDLDYFLLQINNGNAGQLFLRSERDNVIMRIFDPFLNEYDMMVDTLRIAQGDDQISLYWTTLYGLDSTFALLIQGDSRRSQGPYTLGWQELLPTTTLEVTSPTMGMQWRRSIPYTIRWNQSRIERVTLALIKGTVMIAKIKRNLIFLDQWSWIPDEDIEPGNDYRIVLYRTDDPTTMDISDAFEIE